MTDSLIGSFSVLTIVLVVAALLIAVVAAVGLVYYFRSTRSGKYISKPYKPSDLDMKAASVNCPDCNWVNDGESVYCMRCGRVLMPADSVFQAQLSRCAECGGIVRKGESSCPECGHPSLS